MNRHWIIVLLTVLALSATMLLSNGCNLWHAAGKDVEHAGEKMQ